MRDRSPRPRWHRAGRSMRLNQPPDKSAFNEGNTVVSPSVCFRYFARRATVCLVQGGPHMIVLLLAQIISSSPPLPPADAAAVLARIDSPANYTERFICTD